ncbi:protocadherin beta-16-like isoform X3 [Protopterus annectens]|uniref:protocadherin beta-16-like isoform X3 n=1 Tax=Protopterus annectens TaxID=7888 RepID=UPI001CF96D4A|nr:protocadherin beta-16-like isoform X3 [Protopterus annectens]
MGNLAFCRRLTPKMQTVCFLIFLLSCNKTDSLLCYSVREELAKGSVVSNIANDLGLEPKMLTEGGAHIAGDGSERYFVINKNTGMLLINEQIDREEICGEIIRCLLFFQLVIENPLQLHPAEIEILDVNDNAPIFPQKEIILSIPEHTSPGAKFSLQRAQDLDLSANAVQRYLITSNEHFRLDVPDGKIKTKRPEIVLMKQLDYEKTPKLLLQLTAVDGGEPPRTGTAVILINVLDTNDNPPVFNQSVYNVKLFEQNAINYMALKVTATDLDDGPNGDIVYAFSHISEAAARIFKLNDRTGEITVDEPLDFEETQSYELEVEARDSGGLSSFCKVVVEIVDVNDNPPDIVLASVKSWVPENALPQTIVALLNVKDRDGGGNGGVSCSIEGHQPFKLTSSFKNFYRLVTTGHLDREREPEYNITIVAFDDGSPPLSSTTVVHLQISDINDNPPVFSKATYSMQVIENNNPGALIGSVMATDMDTSQNAQVFYSVIEDMVNGFPLSNFITINSNSGNIFAVRHFDYEQLKEFTFLVQSRDSGTPRLSSNATIKLYVIDQNDNAPALLHPSPNDSSFSAEIVPRNAEAGYVVSKVIAVDADSGQNAWLFFHLLKSSDPSLFSVGVHTGEITTVRGITEKDNNRHTLIVIVKDNGRPSLSTTATVKVVVAENLSGNHLEIVEEENPNDFDSQLTVYLIISLAVVTFLFLGSVIMLLIFKAYRINNSKHPNILNQNLRSSDIVSFRTSYLDSLTRGTIQQGHLQEVQANVEPLGYNILHQDPNNINSRKEQIDHHALLIDFNNKNEFLQDHQPAANAIPPSHSSYQRVQAILTRPMSTDWQEG